ncbi:MAG TPA: type ISP restriction/modification enzyme, partial [Blastocatellia bacterium]
MIRDYLKRIEKALQLGNATEHTHRGALQSLIESVDRTVTATNEPRRTRVGAPDLIVSRAQVPVGYVEAKNVGSSLDQAEKSEQIERYLKGLGNLILTDYLEFRWFVAGKHRLSARLAAVGGGNKLRTDNDAADRVAKLLASFLNTQVPVVDTPKDLATRMAAIAQLIRDTIRNALKLEPKSGSLHEQMEGFRRVLLHNLTEDEFADMYAQTICYGLFAARCNHRGTGRFTREGAAYELPRTNPFLRKMFSHIAGPDLDDRIVWAVDDLADLLNCSKIGAILQDFGIRTRREDPVVHFYETFLAAYDPEMREARGVYYTPEPVVSYIVASVDKILRRAFRLPQGLADSTKIKVKGPNGKSVPVHKVLILDPATGTGTFLYEVVNRIFDSFKRSVGMWSGYVADHLLPRLFGFELLMAPYAVAHMKLGLRLAETGYDFNSDERLRVYLTNTLDEAHEMANLPLFAHWLADEAGAASRVKEEAPVMVILGNPPYSGHSSNVGEWIANLLRGKAPRSESAAGQTVPNYFEVDGQPLGERNPKWLNDDYVKFIRFAQWRIEKTGYGVLAFVTNHGYLDNPTFRGMRQSLMKTFDEIYVLDLHGNTKKKERCPDGSKDENVFDIQQGVAISVFVKGGGKRKNPATVRHADLWGRREVYEPGTDGGPSLCGGKYHWLWQNDVTSTKWQKLDPQPGAYLFIPQNGDLREEYERGLSVTEIFGANSVGITTGRDKLCVSFDSNEALAKIRDFESSASEAELAERYGLSNKSGWNIEAARRAVRAKGISDARLVPFSYRPFDDRLLYMDDALVGRSRMDVMSHMISRANIGLCTNREVNGQFRHVLCTTKPINDCLVSLDSKERTYLFPLYLYPNGAKRSLFDEHDFGAKPNGRMSNIPAPVLERIARRLGVDFCQDGGGGSTQRVGPQDIFDYAYAVLHSPAYRRRYEEFLKADFPRIPITSSIKLFRLL